MPSTIKRGVAGRVSLCVTGILLVLAPSACRSVIEDQATPSSLPQDAQPQFTPAELEAMVPGRCETPVSQRAGEAGCYLAATAPIELPEGQLFWHLYTYPTVRDAETARGPQGTIVESFGKVWLYTIAPDGWSPSSGERVAVIGPLEVDRGMPYTARYMEAVFPPGMSGPPRGHRHSGPEAWYVVSGAQCLETPDEVIVARAGEAAMVPEGPAMAISGLGPETRRAVLLVLHPAAAPWTSPAPDWQPKGLCPE